MPAQSSLSIGFLMLLGSSLTLCGIMTDICELGGDFATMRDVHYEVKCWNPLIKSTTAGRGSWDNGGNVASVWATSTVLGTRWTRR